MRIALLTKHTLAHGIGGVQVHADGLARGLRARGHEVVVLTTALSDAPAVIRQDGLETHYLPGTRSGVYSRSWWRESVAGFDRLHAARPFDLVVSEDLAGSSLIRRFPEVSHLPLLHGLTLDHLASELRQIEGGRTALKYLAIKVPELAYYALVHERPLIERAPMVGVETRRIRELVRRWYRVPDARLRLLPSWVDVDLFTPEPSRRPEVREALGIPVGAFVFLITCALTKQKGVQVGLRAFTRCLSAFPRLFLLIVGDGPYRWRLEETTQALRPAGRVRFVGGVPYSGLAAYYQVADAFVFPTLRMEGVPFALLEAMASGLPVIASRIGGVPEAVADTGLLTPPGDVTSLAAAMRRLLEVPHLARQFGEAAREQVKRLYSKADVLAEVESACNELLEGPRARRRGEAWTMTA